MTMLDGIQGHPEAIILLWGQKEAGKLSKMHPPHTYVGLDNLESIRGRRAPLAVDNTTMEVLLGKSLWEIEHLEGIIKGEEKKPRNLVFGDNKNTLAESLGVDGERAEELDKFVADLVNSNKSLEQIVTAFNERGDLTDNEWTAAMFGLGHYCARIGR